MTGKLIGLKRKWSEISGAITHYFLIVPTPPFSLSERYTSYQAGKEKPKKAENGTFGFPAAAAAILLLRFQQVELKTKVENKGKIKPFVKG